MTIPDYPDNHILRMEARDEARTQAIEARRDELLADRSDEGYYPWNPQHLSEAVSEIDPIQQWAICAALSADSTVENDACIGRLLRSAVLAYWTSLADNKAVHEIDLFDRKCRAEAEAAKHEGMKG